MNGPLVYNCRYYIMVHRDIYAITLPSTVLNYLVIKCWDLRHRESIVSVYHNIIPSLRVVLFIFLDLFLLEMTKKLSSGIPIGQIFQAVL